ncbi:MAG: XRE family transcriptional regulator [Alphaproteobacteria bacterium]|nr:XRE family transcriptional regulator [Alphaproteobacteria bacterium]
MVQFLMANDDGSGSDTPGSNTRKRALETKDIAERIEFFRKRKGLNKATVAQEIDLSPQQYTRLSKGERRISIADLDVLQDVLGVSLIDLLPPERIRGTHGKLRQMKVIGSIAAGPLEEMLSATEETIWSAAPEECFAVQVRGDSMDIVLKPGTVCVVDPNKVDLKQGAMYLLAEHGQLTIKEYRYAGDSSMFVPRSTNPEHLPIVANPDIHIYGRVTQAITNF